MYVNARAIIQRDRNGAQEVYLQYRMKPGEPRVLELPGGRVEEFESIGAVLRREVHEETSHVVSAVNTTSTRAVTATTGSTEVECLPVYAAYQTTRGAIDSIGFYFLCTAEGEVSGSDESEQGSWFGLEQVARLLVDSPEIVSWLDQAGLKFHLEACGVAVSR